MSLPSPTQIYGWKGFCLTQDKIKLIITPDIGGRMISLRYEDQELFFANKKHLGETFDFSNIKNLKDLEAEKLRLGHRLWGGDKTWVAPEPNWIAFLPPLDLDASPHEYHLSENTITTISPIDRETGLRITRRVSLASDGKIILDQKFTNESDQPILSSIWDVTQMERPFSIYIPTETHAIKPDTRFEAGISQREKLIQSENFENNNWAKIICDEALQFKYGARIPKGIAMAVRHQNNQTLAMIRTFEIFPNAEYPNNNMIEIYNSSEYSYFEFEILAPLIKLAPKQSSTHQQIWQIKKFDGLLNAGNIIEKL